MNPTRSTTTFALAACMALGGCGAMQQTMRDMQGWQTLIEGGKGMDNFTSMGGANWRAEPDAIVADKRPGTDGMYYLATKTPYKDFQLHVEFWVSEDANSGIYMRCSEVRPMTDRSCHEANIFDKRPDPSYGTGAIVWLVKAPSPMPRTGGQWNSMDITAQGTHLKVVLNGVTTAETNEARDTGGVIGLQYAGGTVKYRSFQIKPL